MFLHGGDKFSAKLKAMSTQEERHAYQLRMHDKLVEYAALGYVSEFYHLIGAFGEFWEYEECKVRARYIESLII